MREIVLDTETTGLNPSEGHRIVEIGAVELINHLPSGRTFHQYINPERSMPQGAFEVHGLSDAFLSDKPAFADIADGFLEFLGLHTRIVIHNAGFDLAFLNHELKQCGRTLIAPGRAIDTLGIARSRFPGSPCTLDALCRRFGIDNSAREKHGALLDSEILASVYLELLGGRQPDFHLNADPAASGAETAARWAPSPRPTPLAARITPGEEAAHAALVKRLGDAAIWRKYA